jgi:meso-butanediol dehydrogenase/(S,S)-butanediol dehydrogenase/diacetyl reductase
MPAMSASRSRHCLVTGGSSGIGYAVAEGLRDDGWAVTAMSRRGTGPAGVAVVAGDAADPDDLRAALGSAMDGAGGLRGLVCSAGSPPSGPWDDPSHWAEVLRVDLTAPFEASRLAWPALAVGHGCIVLVGSIVGAAEGHVRSPAYAAAKAGLEGLARSLAVIGAAEGVRVNVVAPGAIDTPFDPSLFPPDARPDVPLGRMGTAAEVAGVVRFLLSDAASYVSGGVWRVDGGRTALSPADAARAAREGR